MYVRMYYIHSPRANADLLRSTLRKTSLPKLSPEKKSRRNRSFERQRMDFATTTTTTTTFECERTKLAGTTAPAPRERAYYHPGRPHVLRIRARIPPSATLKSYLLWRVNGHGIASQAAFFFLSFSPPRSRRRLSPRVITSVVSAAVKGRGSRLDKGHSRCRAAPAEIPPQYFR